MRDGDFEFDECVVYYYKGAVGYHIGMVEKEYKE
jgi:hypothetical protein